MKLYEFEGKKLFRRYGICVPRGELLYQKTSAITLPLPLVVKAQVYFGERQKSNAVLFARNKKEAIARINSLWGSEIRGEKVKKILIEERILPKAEYYISISYDTDTRSPVLALSSRGGSGVKKARLVPIDIIIGLPDFLVRSSLLGSGFSRKDIAGVLPIVQNLWRLFIGEHALLAEINPLIKTRDNRFIAADAKVILDDEKINPGKRRFIDMDGDIAILASGGGASLLNIDALIHYGGRPANYTEYSGNPPADVVKDLTKRVFRKQGLKGCWVVGGTANFTDIYETMRGFLEGLREVRPKPEYPIVIRRDGPRQKESFVMLEDAAKKWGYKFHLFDSKTTMAETARIMVTLAYGNFS